MFDPHFMGSSQQAYYDINDIMLNSGIRCKATVEVVSAYPHCRSRHVCTDASITNACAIFHPQDGFKTTGTQQQSVRQAKYLGCSAESTIHRENAGCRWFQPLLESAHPDGCPHHLSGRSTSTMGQRPGAIYPLQLDIYTEGNTLAGRWRGSYPHGLGIYRVKGIYNAYPCRSWQCVCGTQWHGLLMAPSKGGWPPVLREGIWERTFWEAGSHKTKDAWPPLLATAVSRTPI